MIELLVVIGIIVLLLAILLPVVSQVRMKAFVAQTEAEMQRIMGGIQAYYHDHNAYPGPLPDAQLAGGSSPKPSAFSGTVSGTVTSSENCVLGLLGFLSKRPDAPATADAQFMGVPQPPSGGTAYTPGDVSNLNSSRPKTFHYIDYVPEEISQNGFAYGMAGTQRATDSVSTDTKTPNSPKAEVINDSNVPEFLDHIPDAMPILYMRAQVGATGLIVSTNAAVTPACPYNFAQLAAYGFTNVSAIDFQYAPPDPATSPLLKYFENPAIAGQARGKDGFILISAGVDRMYGTKDDIIVTP